MTDVAEKSLVVDASVVLKWQLDDEEHVKRAVAIRDAFLSSGEVKLLAPTLIVYEIVNGVSTALRRKRVTQEKATQAIGNLLAAGIELREANPQRTLELGLQHGLSAYDAAYLAVAESEGCEAVTGDMMLYEAVKDKVQWVRWIGEFKVEGDDVASES